MLSRDDPYFSALLERALCAVALLVLSPLLVLIALAVLLDTGLPILFTQRRVGRHAALFTLFKFRTMTRDTRGPYITAAGDTRITRTGKFLRKFKLDELPQLWNIIRGDMRLVGPRPEVPEFVDHRVPVWRSILRVDPGLTDPASLAYYREEELLAHVPDTAAYYREVILPAKLSLNLQYLETRTLASDLQVIMRTVWSAFFGGESIRQAADLPRVTSK
ncbi:MAG: O-antigen biosynthesis protein WlbG [Candidatus Acidiferrum sp.]